MEDVKEGNMPSLFESKHLTSCDNVETEIKDVKSSSPAAFPNMETLTCDQEKKQTAVQVPHQLHAIIINSVQVSELYSAELLTSVFFHISYISLTCVLSPLLSALLSPYYLSILLVYPPPPPPPSLTTHISLTFSFLSLTN